MATAKKKYDSKKQYAVKAAAVVVFVNTVAERYLYQGAAIPAEVDADEFERLLELDLIAEAGDVVTPGTEESVDPAAPPAEPPAA